MNKRNHKREREKNPSAHPKPQTKSQKFNTSIARLNFCFDFVFFSFCFFHSLSCGTIFIPSCTGFQFPINHQQICVLCAIYISQNIDTCAQYIDIYIRYVFAFESTLDSPPRARSISTFILLGLISCRVCHSKISIDNSHNSREGGLK